MRAVRKALLFGAKGHRSAAPLPFLDARTDVAYAYSMRRLRTAYAGPLVNIRRSSDNTAQDFGTGEAAVKDSEVQAFIGAGQGYIAAWYDQSGNGYNMTQSAAGSQPQYGVLSNGLPGMIFNATNAVLAATFALSQPFSFNLVYRRISFLGTAGFWGSNNPSGSSNTFLLFSSSQDNGMFAGASIASDSGTSMPGGTRGVVGATLNSTNSFLEINAATVANLSGNIGTNSLLNLAIGYIGLLNAPNIEVQELIGFNTAHAVGNSTTPGSLQGDNAAMRSYWSF